MPITFIDIERQKSWRISIFFLLLLSLYFVISLALAATCYEIFSFGFAYRGGFFSGSRLFFIFLFSLIIGTIHFFLSTYHAVSYIKGSLGALRPDPEDRIHKRLINIVDEIHAAAGNRVDIQCLVIPTLSMNALSAVDIRGNAIIAITEGLLSRISRTQLEAVLAHEACHIFSGDCLESTVASSLFGIPSAAIEKISAALEGRLFFSPAFLFAWTMVKLSLLLNMFISREREYRADAGAVRITRNPLALAEVLYILARNWRGSGSIGMGLEMLCFMNTADSSLDDSEGWIADLMSTHPPVKKRISTLLGMARADLSVLAGSRSKVKTASPEPAEHCYYALDHKQQWQGPYTLNHIASVPWLAAATWISRDGESVEKASLIPEVSGLFRGRLAPEEQQARTEYACPSCGHPLLKTPYEDTTIYQCRFCGGAIVENDKLARIIARTDKAFSERILTLSSRTLRTNQKKGVTRSSKQSEEGIAPLIPCPKCNDPMMRTFYSQAYLVELDRCTTCDLTWFDYDELEMLQCMIDNRMASAPLAIDAVPSSSSPLTGED